MVFDSETAFKRTCNSLSIKTCQRLICTFVHQIIRPELLNHWFQTHFLSLALPVFDTSPCLIIKRSGVFCSQYYSDSRIYVWMYWWFKAESLTLAANDYEKQHTKEQEQCFLFSSWCWACDAFIPVKMKMIQCTLLNNIFNRSHSSYRDGFHHQINPDAS